MDDRTLYPETTASEPAAAGGDDRSIEILKAAFECADIGVWTFDPASRKTWFSPNIFRQLGLEPDAFEHSFGAFDAFVAREHDQELRTSFRALLDGSRDKFCVEIQVSHASGETRWLESTARRVNLTSGPAVCGAHVDITERKRAERELSIRLAVAEASERRFTELAENIPGAIFQYVVGADGAEQIIYMSGGCDKIWEIDSADLDRDPSLLWEMIVDEDRQAMQASIMASMTALTPWAHRWRIITASGKLKHLDGRGRPKRMPDGSTHYNSLVLDVTDQVRQAEQLEIAQRAVADAHQRLASAVDALPDGFVIFDRDDRIVVFNEAYRALHADIAEVIEVGVAARTILERAIDVGLIDTGGVARDVWIADTLRKRRETQSRSLLLKHGADRWVQLSDRCLSNGELVGLRTDVTAIKAKEEQMRRARDAASCAKANAERAQALAERANARAEFEALHDQLTLCANRRGLMRQLQALDDAGDASSAVIVSIDLDRFKLINDTYGHAAGDAVLGHVAARIKDTVRPQDFVARKGGDEFVVVVDGPSAPEFGPEICRRIIAAASQPLEWEGCRLQVGVSAGFAPAAPGMCAETQLNHADMALYKAKNDGRNRFAAFAPQMASAARERVDLAADLRRAVENGDIEPFFQPQIYAGSGRVRGAEALARWRRPDRGLVPPGVFLPIADELKLTAEIDQMILVKATMALTDLTARGLDLPRVSVNVSARRLRAATLIDEVAQFGEEIASRLAFEVLETVFVDSKDEKLRWTIDSLKELGVSIELDDFGSGHASVASIMSLEPDHLKLDRVFATGVDDSAKALAVLRSLIGVARSFDVGVIAEGVETEAQRAVLIREGCDVLQGFGIGHPAPLEDLAAWLGSDRRRVCC